MLSIISWIIFGAVAGWAASVVAGTDRQQGCFVNVVVGIVGAFLGGWLFSRLTGRAVDAGWSFEGFAVAVIGALLFLGTLSLLRRR